MSKGSTVLRSTGIAMAVFGILNVLWSMNFGFLGVYAYAGSGQSTLQGLLMFYGFFGVMTGIFEIAVASVCFRQSKKAEHWLRCVIFGIVILVLGVINLLALLAASGMMTEAGELYPQWMGLMVVVIGGIFLPLFAILGGILNRPKTAVSEG